MGKVFHSGGFIAVFVFIILDWQTKQEKSVYL